MKTILKLISLACLTLISLGANAQNESKTTKNFIRVYNMGGKKINKGHFKFFNDSLLGIRCNKKLVLINVNEIGSIKTNRSVGQNVLVGSAVGLGTGILIGAASSDQETKTRDGGFLFGTYEYKTGHSPGTAAAVGGTIGLAGGGLAGLVGSLLKKSNTYMIDGKIENLKEFATDISNR